MRFGVVGLMMTVASCEAHEAVLTPAPATAATVNASPQSALAPSPSQLPSAPAPARDAHPFFVPRDLGCFPDHGDPDGTRGRDLDGLVTVRGDMTNEICMAICARAGFMYAGTQSSTRCFCGNRYGLYAPGGSCSDHCAGDLYEICGGSSSNLVYQALPAPAPPGPPVSR